MKKIICLYGGPGSGKSTACAGLFYNLKLSGYNCEMNREYIKDWAWENRKIKSGDQTYIFSKSARKERIYMENEIDFVITDSPLVLTHFYGLKYDPYEQKTNTSLVMLKHHHEICKELGYSVDHYVINRVKPYNPSGRYQTENEAKEFDLEIIEMLNKLNIKFKEVPGDKNAVNSILKNYLPFHSV